MTATENDRLLRFSDVETTVGLRATSVYLLMQSPDPNLRFPQPIKIGNRSRWSERAVQDWIARQKARAEAA